MNETFASLEAFRAADERRRGIEQDLGGYPVASGGRAEVRFVPGTREVYAFFTNTRHIELLGPVASVELADALLRLPGSSFTEFDWVRERIASAPTDPVEIQKAIDYQEMAWGGHERGRRQGREEPMQQRFESVEAFRAADERRRGSERRLGHWPKVEGGTELVYVEPTREVYARFHSGEVELLGEVASFELADALLRIPASSITLLPWIRQRVAGAPTDPAEISRALEDHQRLWRVYDQSRDQ